MTAGRPCNCAAALLPAERCLSRFALQTSGHVCSFAVGCISFDIELGQEECTSDVSKVASGVDSWVAVARTVPSSSGLSFAQTAHLQPWLRGSHPLGYPLACAGLKQPSHPPVSSCLLAARFFASMRSSISRFLIYIQPCISCLTSSIANGMGEAYFGGSEQSAARPPRGVQFRRGVVRRQESRAKPVQGANVRGRLQHVAKEVHHGRKCVQQGGYTRSGGRCRQKGATLDMVHHQSVRERHAGRASKA